MNNKIARSGGRPPAMVTDDRVRQIMKMYYRGGCHLGYIMERLKVSQTTASNLREKAFKAIQTARGNDKELYKDKYVLNCRLEDMLKQTSDVIEKYDRLNPSFVVNQADDVIKLKYMNLKLSILRLMAELNGHIGGNYKNQLNFNAVDQKVLFNMLNLRNQDKVENQ